MMKVYVAGKFQEKDAVRRAQTLANASGHVVTYDWTVHEEGVSSLPQCAIEDLIGVSVADVFLLLWHPHLKGGLVELGMALGLRKTVLVVGCPPTQPCVFFYHPDAQHFETVEAALAEIAIA